MIRLSRRELLEGALLALAGGAALACSSDPPTRPTPSAALGERERKVYAHLRGLMPYFDAEQASADFARAFIAAGRKLHAQVPEPDGLVTTFLLSTDFFRTGADPGQPLRFVHLHSQFDPCANPFFRPA